MQVSFVKEPHTRDAYFAKETYIFRQPIKPLTEDLSSGSLKMQVSFAKCRSLLQGSFTKETYITVLKCRKGNRLGRVLRSQKKSLLQKSPTKIGGLLQKRSMFMRSLPIGPFSVLHTTLAMWWQRCVGTLEIQASFAKEPCSIHTYSTQEIFYRCLMGSCIHIHICHLPWAVECTSTARRAPYIYWQKCPILQIQIPQKRPILHIQIVQKRPTMCCVLQITKYVYIYIYIKAQYATRLSAAHRGSLNILLKNIGLFCRRAPQKRRMFYKRDLYFQGAIERTARP